MARRHSTHVLAAAALMFLAVAASAQEEKDDDKFAAAVVEKRYDVLEFDGGEKRTSIAVALHYWGFAEPAGVGVREPAPEKKERELTLSVQAPPGLRDVKLRHMPYDEAGNPLPAQADASPLVRYEEDESVREVVLTFDVENVDAKGDLVLVVRAEDEEVVPRERRLVFPVQIGEEDTGDRIVIRGSVGKRHLPGMPRSPATLVPVYKEFEPTRRYAHAWTRGEPWLLVGWPEVPKGATVTATGRMTGGYPEFDAAISWSAEKCTIGDMKWFVDGTFNVSLPLEAIPVRIGRFRVTGELVARTGGSVVGRRPFSTSVTYHRSPNMSVKGRIEYSEGAALAKGSFLLEECQPGKRPVQVRLGGRTVWTLGVGGGSVVVPLMPTRPESAAVSFEDFGEIITLPVALRVAEPGGRNRPISRPSRLEDLRRALREAEAKEEDPRSFFSKWPSIAGTKGSIARELMRETRDPGGAPWVAAQSDAIDTYRRAVEQVIRKARSRNPNVDIHKHYDTSNIIRVAFSTMTGAARQAFKWHLIEQGERWLGEAESFYAAHKPLLKTGNASGWDGKLDLGASAIAHTHKDGALAVFAKTGSLGAARQMWDRYVAWQERSNSEREPYEFPLVPDPEFR